MSSLKTNFEKELLAKLAQKSSKSQSEETILAKAFKYFDLDNDGQVTKDEWKRAILKLGITSLSDDNLVRIFNIYDTNKNQVLDYKEFIQCLYPPIQTEDEVAAQEEKPTVNARANPNQKGSNANPGNGYDADHLEEIKEKVRNKLASRGARGIIGLGKSFRIMDDNNSNSLDVKEFQKACRDYKMGLTEDEIQTCFAAFDRSHDGQIDYEEFLRQIRPPLNNFRKKLISQAFDILDKNGNGTIELDDIRDTYNARHHPDVKQGKRTEDEVLMEFLETFEQHHNYINNSQADHVITKDEWLEYYANVSMSIDDDAYFELMMNNCWKMNNATTKLNDKKGWSNKEEGGNQKNVRDSYNTRPQTSNTRAVAATSSAKKADNVNANNNDNESQQGDRNISRAAEQIVDKFRTRLNERGGRGIIGLQRQFKIFDDNNSKSLDYPEFLKACKDFKVDLNQNEIKILFNAFDNDGSGSVDYNEFLREVRGEMNAFRKKITLQAFDKLDTDKSGVVEISEIKALYNCKNHPDVKSGKKTEEEVYGEFLETFEMHHGNTKGRRDKRVTRDEFLEYYNNISSSIDLDEYFEVMMNNAWKLTAQPEYIKNQAWTNKAETQNVQGRRQQPGKPVAPWGTSDQKTSYETSNLGRGASSGGKNVDAQESAVDKFRNKLKARGTRGIMSVRRCFMICDDDGSKTLSFYELEKLCNDYRLELTKQETQQLFKYFDLNNNGTIDYEEFLRGIVGEMNSYRKGIVKKAFQKLDKDSSGVVDVDDLRGVYSARNHPDVIAGKKTEDEVLAEFLDTFEYHFTLLNDAKSKDRRITLEEFNEYYNNISMSIDDDRYFELMMTNAWNLDGKKPYGKGVKMEY